ncbi:DNA polymerase III subunit beta [Candidatus Arsenophonus lipoptenae]|uniref:Beta sliding clamp n=1 Tax=Candidatus Arsenophonus lipoptenae TaxID=634113 RepID=A0A0X9VIW9_9GAMM|nr:DNA polymerase III subunit beta [Candidatus Arsenophonus lipoptenae]AMA64930.1 DNA polymerase III subunit beta [Candidatus Arsenophonus lipoptenae]
MNFTIEREKLIKPLQQVSGPLSSRPKLPILGNLLLQVNKKILLLTSTDLEVEMVAKVILTEQSQNGSITVPARKFCDIWRGLPNDSKISVTLEGDRLLVRSCRSRFSLSTLPATSFPNLDNWQSEVEFELPRSTLKYLIDVTQFSMANHDVRYYLNGMLFEIKGKELRTVATDGHRLAVCSRNIIHKNLQNYSVIVPRKAIIELMRLIDNSDDVIKLQISSHNIRVHIDSLIFTSKLVDGRFPDYRRVLPKNANKIMIANCDKLKQAFSRASILSNEKFHGVRLYISKNQLKITAKNPEQEESEEIIDVHYENQKIEIGFNVSYILDVLNTLKCDQVHLLLTDSNSSIQIEDIANNSAIYIIMPMRL